MKDLTVLMDKDRDYLNKYKESLEALDYKKKEMGEMKMKLVKDLEDKKIKISNLNIDKLENNLRVIILKIFMLKILNYEP